ncbi:Mur ligase [Calycina marina]|uniref:Folylpolyglutamate synthase n=1 Tax=Calycina marina TaxID=1763456 RepID=A0A9P7ZBX5_9HELO|nr:Mur ligase [Calycina marina]
MLVRKLSTVDRSYLNALHLLNSLQSNRTVVDAISNTSSNKNERAIPEMIAWTKRAGYDVSDFPRHGLKCIHVAGTKGKGSVCAMLESILMSYRGHGPKSLEKIGTYTSPHLVTVRERIRIDGSPICEALFAQYFFELWDRMSGNSQEPTLDTEGVTTGAKLGYFRFLTILAFHAFIREGVESAIIECGIGGWYDSTNILPGEAVTVTAITKLGIDHVGMLGDTIEQIAWHKAGIFKPKVPAISVEQVPEAQGVLDKRAEERGTSVRYFNPCITLHNIQLGLEGEFQKDNAILAVAAANSHLRQLSVLANTSPGRDSMTVFRRSLETVELLGRCQVRIEDNIEWHIDGAHTADSIKATGLWFRSKLLDAYCSTKPPSATMLIFNQQDRDAQSLLDLLITTILFGFAAFCRNTPWEADVDKKPDISVQEGLGHLYRSLNRNSMFICCGSVEEAVKLARRVSEGEESVMVLATGSLHLAGGLLTVLDGVKTG